MSGNRSDFLIVGAGVVGLTIARELYNQGHKSITILEKEPDTGMHSSGRNSGVLHGGIYYPAGSLKAKLCIQGAQMMKQYAEEFGIAVQKTGKVIVAQREDLAPQIDMLYQRATSNGAKVEVVSMDELKKIEPEATTFGKALYSPETAVIDPKLVVHVLADELVNKGIKLVKNSEVLKVDVKAKKVIAKSGDYSYGFLINTAGLHADFIAHQFGVGLNYRILPFKGTYKKLKSPLADKIRGSIYPVPDLQFPFLGVHVTRTIQQSVYVGPTSIPAFGRENYSALKGVELGEGARMVSHLSKMILTNANGMRNLIFKELPKYSEYGFWQMSKALAPNMKREDLESTNKVGIRAQLIDLRDMKFIMDFLVEEGEDSLHILNAVSPAFTASFAFARYVYQNYLERTQSVTTELNL